jgi:hypothetical protein
MRPDTLIDQVRAVPFRPFRIVMNNGKSYEIRHPEFIKVGRDSFVYFHLNQPTDPFQRMEIVSLLLVNNIEFLDSAAPVPGNGAA